LAKSQNLFDRPANPIEWKGKRTMSCSPIQYQNVSRAQFTCLQQAAARQLNLVISGDNGSASDPSGSNTITWDYDGAGGVLTLQAVKTSYLCLLVKEKLNSFVGSCS
jgi:hypothetical protein